MKHSSIVENDAAIFRGFHSVLIRPVIYGILKRNHASDKVIEKLCVFVGGDVHRMALGMAASS